MRSGAEKSSGSHENEQDFSWSLDFSRATRVAPGRPVNSRQEVSVSTNQAPAPAIIYVDGEEFIVCKEGDNFQSQFQQVVQKEGGEVALCVYKPRYGGYLRQSLSITTSKGGV